jgi:hypothetical protein
VPTDLISRKAFSSNWSTLSWLASLLVIPYEHILQSCALFGGGHAVFFR